MRERLHSFAEYLAVRKAVIVTCLLTALFANGYLTVLCASRLNREDLLYLDLILLAAAVCFLLRGWRRWCRAWDYLARTDDRAGMRPEGSHRDCVWAEPGREAAGYNGMEPGGEVQGRTWMEPGRSSEEWNPETAREYLGARAADYLDGVFLDHRRELDEYVEQQTELADYVARWTHEVKLPLASLKLMNERNPDEELRRGMQDCIVRMEAQIQSVLMGSKLQRPEHDVRYEKVLLSEAVREAVKHHSWELIRSRVEVSVEVGEISVYSDRRWLVYLLGQLIGNAVKYRAQENARLAFDAASIQKGGVCLTVSDNGIGISGADLPYIFERGYVGRNLRTGDYRSTGMGLYFVRKTAELLHIRVSVESSPGQGTRFTLQFGDMAEYFLM